MKHLTFYVIQMANIEIVKAVKESGADFANHFPYPSGWTQTSSAVSRAT
jgi:hypothetical protein